MICCCVFVEFQLKHDDDDDDDDDGGGGWNTHATLVIEVTRNLLIPQVTDQIPELPTCQRIAVVMYLLYLKLGISALIGSFVCILTITPLQFLIGKAMSKNMEIMAKYTDQRLKKLYDTFLGIKLIKLNAWDQIFIKRITEARNKELIYLNRDSLYWTLLTILTHTCTVLIVFVTLTVFVYLESSSDNTVNRQGFTASRLFSALALFQQLTVPLLIFPVTVPIILSAIVSTKRLERFLAANEIEKHFEGIRNMARILSKSEASLDVYEMHGKSSSLPTDCLITKSSSSSNSDVPVEGQRINFNIPEKPAPLANSEPQTPLSLNEGPKEFVYDFDHKRITSIRVRKELLRNTPYVVIRPKKLHTLPITASIEKISSSPSPSSSPSRGHKKTDSWHRDSLLLKMPENIAVSVKDCKFSWNPEKMENALYIEEMMVPKGKLTMIVGKNGSGKSSLLSALLMEMPLIAGDMIWNKSSTLAFVPQQPWLRNASIRENILFGEEFRPKRYDCVLEICALKPDLLLMPYSDLTMIGERGINLSGGQRQRIAIARALYSSANVVIMDDPFSSLDSKVAHHIFEQSIKKMLSKANRTVILVTQQLQLIHQADYLIVLNDGCLQASGSYEDIEIAHPHIIAEWNSIIAKSIEEEKQQQQENNLFDNSFGAQTRSAKERWNLFRNVAKFALQSSPQGASSTNSCKPGRDFVDAINERSHEILPDEVDDDAFTRFQNGNLFKLQRSPSIVYGSRHLIYDIPLPIDECQMENVILRPKHRTKGRSEIENYRPSSNDSNGSKELRQSILESNYINYTRNQEDVETDTPFQSSSRYQLDEENRETDANVVADLVKSTHYNGGFQQFLHRMSTRKSYTEVTNLGRRRRHLPRSSNDSSILSISEESIALTPTIVPPTQTTISTTSEANTRKNHNSRSVLESEERIEDNPELLANTTNVMAKMGSATATAKATTTATTTTAITKPSWTVDSTDAFSARQTATTVKRQNINEVVAVTVNDCERKYGQIPAEIYLLYLRASGYSKVFIFFVAALIWQSLRVYTDVWLQQWSDNKPTLLTSLKTSANITSIEQSSMAFTKLIVPFFTTATTTTTTTTTTTATAAATTMSSTLLLSAIVSGSQQYNNDNRAVVKAYKPDANFDRNVVTDSDERYDITYYFHIYAFTSCICLIMAIISTTIGQWAGCKARQNLHDKLLQAIMNKSLHFFQVTSLGRILNRFSNDMEIIDKKIAATSQRLLQFSLLCLCAMLINVTITPWFILLTLPICVSYYVVQRFYRCSSRELQRIENATNSPIISHLAETIQGVTTIRAYNQESRFTEILFKRLEANTIAFTILTTSNRWLGISLDYLGGVIVFVTILTALLVATITCYQKQQQLKIFIASSLSMQQQQLQENVLFDQKAFSPAPSLVGLVINYSLLIPIYLNWVVKLLADMETYLGSVERIAYYSERKIGNKKNNNINVKNKIANMLKKTEDKQEKNKTVKLVKVYQKQTHQYVAAFGATNTTKTLLKPTNCSAQSTLSDNNKNNNNYNNKNNNGKNNKNSLQTSTSLECNDAKRRIHSSWCHSSQTSSSCKQYIHAPISWPHRGDIYFENISLRYEGQQENIVKNLTLFIPAGQKVGICGRTGSGKSSLVLSLFGMMQITSGCIYIDGIDISQIHPDEIRIRLSIIPQDVHLFSTTIRENLDPNNHYTDIELWNCLELAQLKEFIINKMPQGLDSKIMDSGIKLSLGHRQLLCLARAILKRSIIVLIPYSIMIALLYWKMVKLSVMMDDSNYSSSAPTMFVTLWMTINRQQKELIIYNKLFKSYCFSGHGLHLDYLIVILFFNKYINRYLLHGQTIEII
uniref:Uncharacterized protein n=1 Tax=Glossina brevipalpis TaxID=37001 RepID=A0A1A9WKE0_9MUSC